MVTLSVLAAVLVVTNQVIVSAVRQVEVSKDSFYVDVILSEGFEHVNYIHQANLLRYGEGSFEDCKLTKLDQTLSVNCDGLDDYKGGRYLLNIDELSGQQKWSLVDVSGDIVDDLEDPQTFSTEFKDFEVYEKELNGGGVVYTNVISVGSLDESYKPLGYYRYIDIAADGDFQIVVAYVNELSNLKVEKPDYVINFDE
jgi:hypothetical protein